LTIEIGKEELWLGTDDEFRLTPQGDECE